MNFQEVIDFNQKNVTTGLSKKGYGYTYFAKKDFKPHEKIMEGFGKILDHQTAHSSVQIDHSKHYLPVKWTGKYWNHSCSPNMYIRTRKDGFPTAIALKNIKKGEELTYNYSMTELSWAKHCQENNARCLCGTKKCKGKILSFSELSKKEKDLLKHSRTCSNYLLKV